MLKSQNFERLYIGSTRSVEKRLIRHNNGKVLSTKSYQPWVLFGFETYKTLREARRREKYLKSLKNPKYLIKIFGTVA